MHPDRESPASIRCAARQIPKLMREVIRDRFFRYLDATIKRVVAISNTEIHWDIKNSRKTLGIRNMASYIHGSSLGKTKTFRKRWKPVHATANLVFRTNAGSLGFISGYGVSRTSTLYSVLRMNHHIGPCKILNPLGLDGIPNKEKGGGKKRQLGPLRLTMW